MADSSPMMQQYLRLKAEQRDAFLFFRLGDFYEMFNQDAVEASRLLGLTLTARNGTPMCGVPHHAAKSYIAKLLSAGRKIAICEQLGLPAGGKGIADRQVVQVVSPGTVVDEEFLEQASNNFLLSLARLPRAAGFGVALFDLSTGELSVQALPPQGLGAELATLLAKWQFREILVQESLLSDAAELGPFLREHPEIVLNRFGDWLYDLRAAQEQLCQLIGVHSLASFGLADADPLLAPLAAVLHYGEHATRHRLDQIRGVALVRREASMQLDETSVKNLELVRNQQDGGKNFSLLAVLDHTRTAMGGRLLRQWLLEPLQDRAAIEARLDQVEQLYRDQVGLGRCREQLSSVADLQRLVNRLALDKAHPKDLVALGKAIRQSLAVLAPFAAAEGSPMSSLAAVGEAERLELRAGDILAALVDEPALQPGDGDIIRGGRDAKVDELRRLRENSAQVLEDYIESERQASGIASLRVRSNNIIGLYIELTKSNVAAAPGHFIRKQSLVGGERYTTERLSELEREINAASELCRERERQLFLELRQSVKPDIGPIVGLGERVAAVDCLVSLAWAATAKGYTRPAMCDDRRLVIEGGRHPVVEEHLAGGGFIPNDLALAAAGQPATTALITGPNMAGKSTYLRQSALIALMAHVGSFVPAARAEVGLVDRIFCRVGASDNLARGESTFLVEMNEAAYILRMAGPSSLVIMDEVGRGTGTRDGLSIAQAILEHLLRETRCRCLFATHFHELTAVDDPGLRNLSMAVEDQDGRITFLKKVRPGPSNNSYGIHVAQLAGLPAAVIARAQALLRSQPGADAPAEAPAPAAPGHGPASQAALFGPLDQVESELANFAVEKSTPLQALAAIERWKGILRGD